MPRRHGCAARGLRDLALALDAPHLLRGVVVALRDLLVMWGLALLFGLWIVGFWFGFMAWLVLLWR